MSRSQDSADTEAGSENAVWPDGQGFFGCRLVNDSVVGMTARVWPESPDGSFWVEWHTVEQHERNGAGYAMSFTATAISQLGGRAEFAFLSVYPFVGTRLLSWDAGPRCKACRKPIEDDTNGFCPDAGDPCWRAWCERVFGREWCKRNGVRL